MRYHKLHHNLGRENGAEVDEGEVHPQVWEQPAPVQ